MMSALNWLTPDMIQALGWTLVHFLWQGAAIAVLLYMATAFSRSALVRYNAGLAALLLIAAAPIVTFFALQRGPQTAIQSSPIKNVWDAIAALPNSPAAMPVSAVNSLASVDWLRWFVCAWFAGVLVFAIRALGGWVLLERLRREKAQPIAASLLRRCSALQQRLGVSRTVRYLESYLMDSPAVVGWFRPVVLLPVTALTGLAPEQLEAVIAHELAHIKRLDCFVNLFQIAVETLLFYHPAVWWVSRCVRIERENCCDDIAVRICGNAGAYARALTLMETWRATPALVLAANSASLKSRISRLLGLRAITHSVPRAGLAAIGVLCAAGALLASTTFNVTFTHSLDPNLVPPHAIEQTLHSARTSQVNLASRLSMAPLAADVEFAPETTRQDQTAPTPPPAPSAPPPAPSAPPAPPTEPPANGSYVDGIRSAGFTNISVNDLIALKEQGVTPEYIREVRAAGLNPTVHELISMKAQGVDPQYLREVRAAGLNPTIHELIAIKATGVTPDYVRKVRSNWNDVTIRDLIAMRAQGVEPADAVQYRQLGLKDLTVHHLISLKAMGVTPDYIRAMQSAGLSNLSIHEYISAKAMGITPEFIQTLRSHGFTNLSLHQLIGLKMANVF